MSLPTAIVDAYSLDPASVEPITIGLVNQTFVATRRSGSKLIVQKLHATFAASVNHDIDAITTHLASHGMLTPRVVRTRDGKLHVDCDGVYRALTFLEGTVHTEVSSQAIAEEAGRLAGRFHHVIAGLDHKFRFTRDGVHDTAKHVARLRAAASSATADEPIRELAATIERAIAALPRIPPMPTRILHGDLKITNLLFSPEGSKAIALLDLDTMQHGPIAFELGDALRSWSNPRGESDVSAYYDVEIADAAIRGFREGASGAVGDDEIATVQLGTATIAFELAARFATDAVDDRYFGWDETRFASRREHNLVRARSQLALGYDVSRKALGIRIGE